MSIEDNVISGDGEKVNGQPEMGSADTGDSSDRTIESPAAVEWSKSGGLKRTSLRQRRSKVAEAPDRVGDSPETADPLFYLDALDANPNMSIEMADEAYRRLCLPRYATSNPGVPGAIKRDPRFSVGGATVILNAKGVYIKYACNKIHTHI